MSLTVSENAGREIPILPEGSYVAVCNMLVDLGLQYNKTYGNSSRKVLIGWELPEELIEIGGEPVPRTINQRYTASLNEKSVLRRDLAAWRGRDFTPAELSEFNLRNIVGAPCLLQVIHREYNGRKYANMASIMTLPKGMIPLMDLPCGSARSAAEKRERKINKSFTKATLHGRYHHEERAVQKFSKMVWNPSGGSPCCHDPVLADRFLNGKGIGGSQRNRRRGASDRLGLRPRPLDLLLHRRDGL